MWLTSIINWLYIKMIFLDNLGGPDPSNWKAWRKELGFLWENVLPVDYSIACPSGKSALRISGLPSHLHSCISWLFAWHLLIYISYWVCFWDDILCLWNRMMTLIEPIRLVEIDSRIFPSWQGCGATEIFMYYWCHVSGIKLGPLHVLSPLIVIITLWVFSFSLH